MIGYFVKYSYLLRLPITNLCAYSAGDKHMRFYPARQVLTHSSLETPKKGNWQTEQTQIRRLRTRRLIMVSTVC